MGNSLMIGAAKMGMDFRAVAPKSLFPTEELVAKAKEIAKETGAKITLFDELSKYVTDKKDNFCRAIINQLVNFSFEKIFEQKFDFFSTIFEYLIKDYNKDGGGKYAEYYTPHAVARIMAAILVPQAQPMQTTWHYDYSLKRLPICTQQLL